MISYDLRALIDRFDTGSAEPGVGTVVGALSGFIGEAVLLDLLADALRGRGAAVDRLPGKPTRDDAAFAFDGIAATEQRYLDAWLVLDDTNLIAVECKHITSSSLGRRTVGADIAQYAQTEWQRLHQDHLDTDTWTGTSKIGLPLRPPRPGLDGPMTNLRRVLAIWTPISVDGHSNFSPTSTTSPVDGAWQQVPVEVFSGSLYARTLLDQGRDHVEATVSQMEIALDALEALYTRAGDAPASPQ
jgi:hypothetical protein